ncbi:glycosyltransferase family 57 protein [Aplosporella prunicola CBS 121167]|uniref:Alpha-1,3-glucosyltransferase n=1 Tax=Aplosporella prunicola CBS 121167 TaxID=1176127 RepID=A0A6A6BQP0_9PEZI|nr:glycosyltransferase family 57 protein [Aplosporella prunicola CBS 121167]KAF2146442.1 glycosyltransferase family 57 protein [Aplosporella prunicola CBS 121167]
MNMGPPSHKPRKKKADSAVLANPRHGTVLADDKGHITAPGFPLVAFLWPAKGTVTQWVVLPLVLMAVGLFRWATAFWGYSGFQKPPMHGDFEAQRHWMEVTTNLPISQWYFHDLEWWGLDYPPLTAYHSWLLGKIGQSIDPSWFALYTSRGLDDPTLKIFMRASVFVSEYLIYIPAAIIFLRRYSRLQDVNTWEYSIALVAILMQPATILIDHGHFQYNTVMLGLVLASMSSMVAGRPMWSCVYFVAALGFKQMALFYAPVVFAYLLGVCLFPRINILRFIGIALFTVLSFAILYAPLILGTLHNWQNGLSVRDLPAPPLLSALPVELDEKAWYYPVVLVLAQSVHRIFPFARGLFEDKVANVWCAIHTFHKLHVYPSALVQRAALLATSAAIAPPCLILFLKPKKELIPFAFAATSWGFFLCSYQVHEKNVLLPLLPMTVLLGAESGLTPSTRAWVGLANMLGSWTMFPLLKRDELRVPYFVVTLLWAYLMGLPPTSFSIFRSDRPGHLNILSKLIHLGLYVAMVAWHYAEAFVPPPSDKPDLWVVVNVLIGAPGFGLCYLWCLWNLLVKSQLFGGNGSVSTAKKTQ